MALPPITTTTTTPCQDTYNSIALKAGEQFILPPGATIIGATDINAITSECPLPDTLETLQCYIGKAVQYENNDGDGTWFEMQATSGDYQKIVGFTFNNTFYPITPTSNFNGTVPNGILILMQQQIPAIVNVSNTFWDDGSNANWIDIWQIQTFPSIANNLFVNIETSGENFNPSNNPYIIPFISKADANIGGAPVPDLCPAV